MANNSAIGTINALLGKREATSEMIILGKGDLYRLQSAPHAIRVLSGTAWVTQDFSDVILKKGEQSLLTAGKYDILVSAIGSSPLVMEIVPG
jgi:hypothetical protein